jgi:2-iminobutanoate/2-iminopropanoate deaminase
MEKEIIHIPKLSEMLAELNVPLSPVVKAGDFLYVSGMPPLDLDTGAMLRGDIETQTERVLQNIAYALDCAGSSMEKVVKVNIFVTNAAYFKVINDIYRRHFPSQPPARTFCAMASWPMEFDIEIECVALA